MRWNLELGTLFGIRVRLHLSFLLLLGWVLYLGYSAVSPVDGVQLKAKGAFLSGSVLITIFAIVVMHELAHSLVARAFGIGVKDIILLPIGGVARLERMAPNPKQEILIAAAGPASNFALAVLTAPFLFLLYLKTTATSSEVSPLVWLYAAQVYFVNLLIGTFNLIPAFPMDGGRILRAILVKRRGYLHATVTAARLGRFIAITLIIVGILTGRVWLPLVALFVLFAGHQEALLTRRLAALHPSFRTASPRPPRSASPLGTADPESASPTKEEAVSRLRQADELLRSQPRFQAEVETDLPEASQTETKPQDFA